LIKSDSITRFGVACSILGATHAMAEVGESCVGIEDAAVRLECFDEAYAGSGLVADPTVSTEAEDEPQDERDTGKWEIEFQVSQLDDSQGVFLWLESEQDVSGPYSQPGPLFLHLRCFENTTSAVFYFNDHFMSSIQGYGRIQYRIDDRDSSTIDTEESTNNMALGLWQGRRAIPWIKEILDGEQLIVRATPFNGSMIEATFDIRGTAAAVDELRSTCGW
jgi:type VI secretion system protein VasI